jgi:ribosomal protein S18 acetylase RimI-like enzyme
MTPLEVSQKALDRDAPVCRPMRAGDLPVLDRIATEAHPDYPEDRQVFAERLELYPQGCFVIEGSTILGYAISHPWTHGAPPELNSKLGALPAQPSTYYLHDVALCRSAHGLGLARTLIEQIVATAKAGNFRNLSLVSVNSSLAFWTRNGFRPTSTPCSYAGGVYMDREL